MKSVYAKDIKAITKMFNLSEDENWFLNNLSDSINSEKSEICMDIQEVLLYGTSIDEKANAVKALLVYFGAKAQKENDLTITDFTLHFSCCFTKLLHSLFITLLNNFTM